MNTNRNTCCFIGHRRVIGEDLLKSDLCEVIEILIVEKRVDTFLFGSKSRFNSICLELVTQFKEKYPHIKRVYVRAEYPYINERYKNYLLENYEDTYYPEKIKGAGKYAYVERNYYMIDNSNYCVIYFEELRTYKKSKSGTKIALDYAVSRRKNIIKLSI